MLWGWMLGQGATIQFAHRTFRWSNDARGMAAVIIGGAWSRTSASMRGHAATRSHPDSAAPRLPELSANRCRRPRRTAPTSFGR